MAGDGSRGFGRVCLQGPSARVVSPPAELAAVMHGAWVDFARTGRPGWDACDRGTRATMTFDVDSRLVDDPRPERRMVWDGVR